jgi:hypothetical protein
MSGDGATDFSELGLDAGFAGAAGLAGGTVLSAVFVSLVSAITPRVNLVTQNNETDKRMIPPS